MYQRVKGMNDFYPQEKEVQNRIFDVLRKSSRKFGFSEVEAPALETLKLLTAKSGEEIGHQIFTLKKQGTEEIGLRFDLTIPMARMFVAKQKELSKPVKWFCIGRMWRYEAPQKGREREFYQLSAELFGSEQPEADAEVINLCIDCLKNLGLKEKDFVVKVSNRKLLEGLLEDIAPKLKLDVLARVIDKSSKLSKQEFEAELQKLGLDAVKRTRIRHVIEIKGKPSQIAKKIRRHLKLNKLAMQGMAELENIIPYLDDKTVVVDLSVARGLAYYTGIVFEVFDRDGIFRAIAGGGRYDDLVKFLGGESCPATGFGLGYSILSLLLEQKGLVRKACDGPDFYIAPVNAKMAKRARAIADKLRKKYSVEIDLMTRKLGKQLNYASSIRAKQVVIVGPDDVKQGKVVLRDMITGKQKKISLNKLQ